MFRKFYNTHKHSTMAPLKQWSKTEILKYIPDAVKAKYALEAYPECVIQELFLVKMMEIPTLFGETEVLYSVDLTDAAKIGRADINRVYEPYKRRQEAEKRKKEAAKAKEEKKQQEEKKPTEKQKQKKLFEEDSQFSPSDPVLYFAKVEYYKTYRNESINRIVYMDKPTVADAVIFAGIVYLGGWKPKNKKVTSKGVKVLQSQPGTLYEAPEPYKGIIGQHPEIEERIAAQKEKARKQKEKEERAFRKMRRDFIKKVDAMKKQKEKEEKATKKEAKQKELA